MSTTHRNGFTLLELLVAMAIFAIVGILAMGGLNAVLGQREAAKRQLTRLHDVQRAVRLLTNDLGQVNSRYVRDLIGGGVANKPPLQTSCDTGIIVCLSRNGWRNPFWTEPRGTLQRLQYRVEDGKLIREYWPVMDRVLVTQPRSEILLTDVQSLEVNFMEPGGTDWVPLWPPLQAGGAAAGASAPFLQMPPAIRISLRLKDWGEIERVVEVPG